MFPSCEAESLPQFFLASRVPMVTMHSVSSQRGAQAGSSSEVPAARGFARGEPETCRGAGQEQGRSHKPSEGRVAGTVPDPW